MKIYNEDCFMYDEVLGDKTCGVTGRCTPGCPFFKTLEEQMAIENKIIKRFKKNPDLLPYGMKYVSRITGRVLISDNPRNRV